MSKRTKRNTTWPLVGISVGLCIAAAILLRPQPPIMDVDRSYSEDYGSEDPPYNTIGIELGETYSRVGMFQNGRVHIIVDGNGLNATPSYVAFTNEGTLVGYEAKKQAAENPQNTIYDIRRLIGRDMSDLNIHDEIQRLLYDVVDRNGKPVVKVKVNGSTQLLAPEEILAKIIGKLKSDAEAYLLNQVKYAVITVPAYFNNEQRQAIKDAARLVGLEVHLIVNEPTAASIAHGLDRSMAHLALIYQLGEEIFDATILDIHYGVHETLAMAGDRHFGGKDLQSTLLTHLIDRYNSKNSIDITTDTVAMEQLRHEVEKAERKLSGNASAIIEIQARDNVEEFSETITPAQFTALHKNFFKKTLQFVQKVIDESQIPAIGVVDIVLVGSPVHIAKIQPFLEEHLDGKKALRHRIENINFDEIIVYGAAMKAKILSTEDSGDIGCHPLDTRILGLGIETTGGTMTELIARNTIIPTRKTMNFTTTKDNQSKAVLRFFEGERLLTKSNRHIGNLELKGISPAARGVPVIQVAFEIDPSNKITVTAQEKKDGKRTFPAKLVMTDDRDCDCDCDLEEICAIVADAEANHEEDIFARSLAMYEAQELNTGGEFDIAEKK